jgi:hypothetical protein
MISGHQTHGFRLTNEPNLGRRLRASPDGRRRGAGGRVAPDEPTQWGDFRANEANAQSTQAVSVSADEPNPEIGAIEANPSASPERVATHPNPAAGRRAWPDRGRFSPDRSQSTDFP